MQVHFPRTIAVVALAMASMLMTIGCGTTGDGDPGGGAGNRGTGGGAGNGGTSIPGLEGVTQCVSSAYQVVFRGLIEPLDPLLRYIDTPVSSNQVPPPPLRPDAPTVPQISTLTEYKDVPGVYSRFVWEVADVEGVSDPAGMLTTVDFEETSSNLDFGIGNSQVVHVPWTIAVGTLPTVVGAGKMSVVGLGEDTIKMSILPLDAGLGNDGEGPWYGGVVNICRFEVFNFSLHLNLATPGSKPFAVVVGFTAEGGDYDIENGWFYFEEDDTVRFEGDLKTGGAATPVPFNLTLDYRTDPATVSGTFGDATLPPNCTIDLGTFDMSC